MFYALIILFSFDYFFFLLLKILNIRRFDQQQNTSISKLRGKTSWNRRKHWNRCIDQIIAALKQCQRSWRQPNTGFIRGKERTQMSALTTTTQPWCSANCFHGEHTGWWWPVFHCRQKTSSQYVCVCVWEWNPGYLPIASSMMLIWLSEGDRIFGGLSVRGAVEWQTETKMLKMATSSFPSGLCVYD